ncbi:PREDICTED: charged multivesicular body protein 6-B-like [Branchiostoma belcheri]|uniref:Charged multivesicular body protein 6-B-like n=1 Tax=Branchiostoma belcheri TaxID=7741 RepID=A0A6P4XSJ1_BRABE|nr:PREDICTED: charged multivesicular body protein 6-B-like [Branchiostoma belcheri]
MGSLFGKHKKKEESRITEQDKAVLQLKQQRDKLKQYQKKIQANLDREREVAKRLLKDGKKEKAKLLLKKKRYQENMLQKTDNQIDQVEKMVDDLEFASIEMKVVEGLKKGNDCLKEMHKILSLENVEKILDETQEAVEYQREIDDLLAGGILTDEDEAAVLAELDEITKADLPQVPDEDVSLPEVPRDRIPEAEAPKERQRELVAAS